MTRNKIVHWLLVTSVTTSVVVYLVNNTNTLYTISKITFSQALVLLLLICCSFICLSYQFKVTMLLFKVSLSAKEWIGLTICNNMYNYILPARGGAWLRAIYLKKKYNFEYSHYIPLLFTSYIIMCLSSSLLGMFCVGFSNLIRGEANWNFFLLFPVLFFSTLILWRGLKVFSDSKKKSRYAWLNSLTTGFRQGFKQFYSNYNLLFQFFVANSCFIIFNGIGYGYCLMSLGLDISILSSIGVMALTAFSMPISLTPGNLGVREMIMSLSCTFLGVPFDEALLAACIVRAIMMLAVFSVGITFNNILLRDISRFEKDIANSV